MEQGVCFFCSDVIIRDDAEFDSDWLDGDGYNSCPARNDQPHTPTDPKESDQ